MTAANIKTPIYAYLPAKQRVNFNIPGYLDKYRVPFSAMRSDYDSNAIRNCPGAVNLDNDFGSYYSQSTGSLPTLLGPVGSTASTWLVRNTEQLESYDLGTPAGWNQCHIFDINTVVAGTPDQCNIMKEIGKENALTTPVIRIQESQELIGSTAIDPRCSEYPANTGACSAVIGAPFTREGGYSVYDPNFFQTSAKSVSSVGFAVILYNSDDGPPKELDFSRVGTDAMSSTQPVSSRTIFTRFNYIDSVSSPMVNEYWNVEVQLSVRNRYLTAADALASRYTHQTKFSYTWTPAPLSSRFNHINIQFKTLESSVLDDQVAVTALATFVAIVTFAGTIWGKRDTAVDICQFVWKKYREYRARKETVQDVPLK